MRVETVRNLSPNIGARHEDHYDSRASTLVAFGASPAAAQKITFTLNWVAGGDHAPYFYAQKMGWYKQAGLDVDFETGRGSAASAQKVGAGHSQLGLSDMAGVLLFRGKGVDAVGVMNVYANSPQGLYWLKSSGIQSAKDLAGKKIGNPAGDGARTMWPALARTIGIDPNSVTWVNIDANSKLSALSPRPSMRPPRSSTCTTCSPVSSGTTWASWRGKTRA